MIATDRLAAIDTAYLHAERAGYPIHVGSVATFEAAPLLDACGALRLDELRAIVSARLDLLPRLRRRVVWPPFGLARPQWVDDVDFDVTNHVDAVAAPAPGDDEALRQVAAATWSELLDRAHPLWHMRFVTGLDGGRIGLVERAHHALVDGVSGVDVAAVLLDLTPDVEPLAPSTWRPARTEPAARLAAESAWQTARQWAGVAVGVGAALLHPSTMPSRARTVADTIGTLIGDAFAPGSSLNARTGTDRRLAWVRTRLSEVKAAAAASGATANDVVLTAVAGGVRAALLARGEVIAPGATLKVLVPVSVRRADEHGALGNRVSGLLLPLPIGLGDPNERLKAVAAAMATLKAEHGADATEALLHAADLLPPAAIRLLAPAVHHQPFINLVVTNVPGPGVPLYLHGARMLEAFPIVPLVGNLSIGVAALSYDGALNIGLTADAETCADLEIVVAGIERALDALRARPARADGQIRGRRRRRQPGREREPPRPARARLLGC